MAALDVVPGLALGPAVIGADEGAIVQALGTPRVRRSADNGSGRSLWWQEPSVRVDIDEQGLAVLCEATFVDGDPQAVFDGIDLLGVPASEVAELLASTLGGYYEEGGHTFTCPSGLSLWRDSLPNEGPANPDDRGGDYWRTVAVAAPGYW